MTSDNTGGHMRQFLKSFVLAILLAGGALVTPQMVQADAAQTPCSEPTAVVCGGTASARELVRHANNDPQQDNLKAIYSRYGLKQADYAQFVASNTHGTLYKDGTIKVNGKVVGRSTLNVSRVKTSTFTEPVKINGHTYWGGDFGSTYHADQADVLVLMKNGKLQFAAITSCGNPQEIVAVQPPEQPEPQPVYQCLRLDRQTIANKDDTYSFKAIPRIEGGAKLLNIGYDFGDGSTRIVQNPDQYVQHTFKKSATVQAMLQVRLPNGSTQFVNSVNCRSQVTVKNQPPQPKDSNAYCSAFNTPELINQEQRQYRFTVTANTLNATFKRAEFRFSNSQAVVRANPNNANQASVTHSFAEDGTYNVVATLYFTDVNGKATHGDCSYQLTVTTPVAKTEECSEDQSTGKGDECGSLLNTGPGSIVASVFGGAGIFAAAGHYFVRRRLGL